MSWWTETRGLATWSIGLRGAELCSAKRCAVTSLGQLEWSPHWIRAGTASYAAAIMAGALLLAAALGQKLGRARALILSTALVATVSAGATGVAFVWLVPSYPGTEPGFSMYAYFAGVLAGTLACVLGLRAPAHTSIVMD